MTNTTTRDWQDWITREIADASRKTLEAAMSAVGEVLAKERAKMRAELEAEVLKLRNEFLSDRLDAERGVKRHLKAVPPSVG